MSTKNLGEKLVEWANGRRDVRVLLMIGSRVRRREERGYADDGSDWDFQVVTTRSYIFLESGWVVEAGLGKPIAYVARTGRLGGGIKVTAVLNGGELDVVIIPAWEFRVLTILSLAGVVETSNRALQGLRDLSSVWKGGVVVAKGSRWTLRFVSKVRDKVGERRLDDNAIWQIAEGFVCDYVSTKRKLERGEIIAAQRWLHLQLGEANLALLHEFRRRGQATSYPDARRLEFIARPDEVRLVEIDSALDKRSLEIALDKSKRACIGLVNALLQGRWHWPELPSSLRTEELRDDVL